MAPVATRPQAHKTDTNARVRGMQMRSRPARSHKARAAFLRRVPFRLQLQDGR